MCLFYCRGRWHQWLIFTLEYIHEGSLDFKMAPVGYSGPLMGGTDCKKTRSCIARVRFSLNSHGLHIRQADLGINIETEPIQYGRTLNFLYMLSWRRAGFSSTGEERQSNIFGKQKKPESHTDKKENQIFLIQKEIQNGAVAKSSMTNGLLMYDEIFAHFLIYCSESPSSYMTLQLLHSDFPYKWGKFDFLFYQCTSQGFMWHILGWND